MSISTEPRISLIGATGAVGIEFLRVLDHMGLQYRSLDLVASERSAGAKVTVRGQELVVRDIDEYDFSNCDIAFFTAGASVSRDYAPRAAEKGCVVIDNTSHFRMVDGIDLVVPQINGHLVDKAKPGTIIANPNCSTIQIVKALAPIRELFGYKDAVCSTYQAASGAGREPMEEMLEHSRGDGSETKSQYFVAPLAYNVVPVIDEMYDDGWTKEELKVVRESRKILGVPDLEITATTVRVPVAVGHSVAMYVRTEKPVDREALFARWSSNDELIAYSDHKRIPTPRFIEQRDKVYVGRVRLNREDPCGLWTWIVADNLWVGAAYNAAQIAVRVMGRG